VESFDVAVLACRIVLGSVIVAHGINKVAGTGGLEGTANWFAGIGLRRPVLQARLAAGTEIVAGTALVLGLFTAVASSAIVGLMTVAVITVHGRNGFFIFRAGGGWEYCFVLAAMSVTVAALGPGSASIDEVIGFDPGAAPAAAVAAAGVAVAGALLAVFWRPVPTERP